MTSLVLQLPTSVLELKIGDTLQEVRAKLMGLNHQVDDDPEVGATYIELNEDGVDLVLKKGHLSSVFLFLDPVPPRTDAFEGQCSFLSDDFFSQPSETKFSRQLQAQGFSKPERRYPNAVDYINSTVRLRYETRSQKRLVLFDDGKFVR